MVGKSKKSFFKDSVLVISLKESFRTLRKNKLTVAKFCGIDLLFFVVFAIIYSNLALKLLDHLYIILSIIGSRITSFTLGSDVYEQFEDIALQDQTLDTHIFAAIKLSLLILLIFYVLWNLFQGYNWKLTHKLMGKDVKFLKFLKRFSIVNLIFFLFFGVITYVLLQISLYNMESFVIAIAKVFAKIGVFVFVAAFFYFLGIIYVLIAKKSVKDSILQGFSIGFRSAFVLVPGFLILVLIFYVILNIISFAGFYSYGIGALLGFVLVLPFISWVRIFCIEIVEKIEKK